MSKRESLSAKIAYLTMSLKKAQDRIDELESERDDVLDALGLEVIDDDEGFEEEDYQNGDDTGKWIGPTCPQLLAQCQERLELIESKAEMNRKTTYVVAFSQAIRFAFSKNGTVALHSLMCDLEMRIRESDTPEKFAAIYESIEKMLNGTVSE